MESVARMLSGNQRQQRRAVFRKPPLTAFCMAGDVFFIAGFAYIASVVPQPGLFLAALIFTGLTYLLWLIGWHSAIRLDESGVIVDNGLMRHEISWDGLSDIKIGYGLTFGLRNGGEVGSVMFGGSVIGAVIGYKYTEKIAERMRQYRNQILADGSKRPTFGGYRSGFHVPRTPLLAILIIFEFIATIAVLAR